MLIKYDANIENDAIKSNLKRLTNQVYKLLPNREEGVDWKRPLTTILEEFAGMDRLFLDHHTILFSLMCKLEGLFSLDDSEDNEKQNFFVFRKTVFECLSLVNELVKVCQ
jgi:hypothetical protein